MKNINWKKVLTGISGASLLFALLFRWLDFSDLVVNTFYFIAILSGGYFVFLSAIKGLIKQHFLNIDFLVTVAAVGAIYINQLIEAAAVIFFFSLAEALEEFGIEKAKRAVEKLIAFAPKKARVKLDDTEKELPVEEVKINEVVIVKPGDQIPLDGEVIKGSSSVDEATITGEPLPKDKRVGDKVFASTFNQQGYLEIKVTKEAKDSTLAKIIALTEKAQREKAPYQAFIDKFAKYYTPSVVTGAVLLTVSPVLFFNAEFSIWFYRALVLLVIACPCALVISTPVAITSAMGGASRKGVLIKGGKYLETIARIKAIAFDKTRTLTIGKPYVSDILTFGDHSEEEVLADAAGIEKFSNHPLAKSIVQLAEERGIKPHPMEKFEAVPGKGGKADCLVCAGTEHCIGNLKLLQINHIPTKEIFEKIQPLEKQGKTAVLVTEGKEVIGALGISDEIRKEAKEMIKKLKQLKIEEILLITGDNFSTASFVAQKLGISKVYASLLPDEKVIKVKETKKSLGSISMVGDGVNDAPSLAASTVGIAMGASGSDIAIETADVALMNDNLNNIPYLISLGRKTLKTIKQNILASILVKALFLGLTIFGFIHLEIAIGTDVGIALIVILNSLKLFHFGKQSYKPI